jgi:hypothetical protein
MEHFWNINKNLKKLVRGSIPPFHFVASLLHSLYLTGVGALRGGCYYTAAAAVIIWAAAARIQKGRKGGDSEEGQRGF